MLLLRRARRGGTSTCLVDLDFQHGACADYLDIEPRLDIGEIEPRPERLDGQLLEVMLSQPRSRLAVVAAPNRPADMRSFDADLATRLLLPVSSRVHPGPPPGPAAGRPRAACGGAGESYGGPGGLLPSRRARAVETLTRNRKMLGRFPPRRLLAPELVPAPEVAPAMAPVPVPVEPEPA